jgi:C4-dicarboxylate transporter DctM subunit
MEGPIVGVYGIGIMFAVLFLFKIPAGFTMALVGFLGFAYVTSFKAAFGMVGTDMWGIFSNYGLTVIPMFILVGEFVHYGGYNNGLYHATYRWFGHYKGGLAITTIMACAAFSAISGSNTATAATMSKVAIPEMKKYNYHPQLNAGSVAAGATLGVLIPPSIVLVVYGLYTGQSIGKLFFGNIIPSAILTIAIAATVFFICWRHPDWGPKGPKSTWKERFQALPDIIDILILFAIIHVRPVHGRRYGHRSRRRQLHPRPHHLRRQTEALLAGIFEVHRRYPPHLLSGLHDCGGSRDLQPLFDGHPASL